MLKGSELLAKVAELSGQSKTDIARACGYVATKKDGSERVLFSAYYEAIIEAKGVDLGTPAPKAKASRGKAPSYKAKIAKTGTLPVGGAYTSQAGWNPGDEVIIDVNGDTITLKRTAVAQAAEPVACAAPAAVASDVITYESKPAPAPAERELAPF
jgi:hypothetical protein